jgi:hypothetical protein
MNNFGHAGPVFIKKLMEMGVENIKAMIQHALDNFSKKYGATFAGQDRFWEVGIVLADLGNQLAHDFGLIAYDYQDATRWAVGQLTGIKDSAAANRLDAFDILNMYIKEHMASTIAVLHTAALAPVRGDNRPYINDILVRYDMYRKDAMPTTKFDSGTVMFERTNLRKWLSSRGYDYKAFLLELEIEHVIATPASEKAYFGKGIGIKVPQCYVIGVNLNHPRLQGVLDDADQMLADQTLGQLKVAS